MGLAVCFPFLIDFCQVFDDFPIDFPIDLPGRPLKVEQFLLDNPVDENAAHQLRTASPELQQTVLSRGNLRGAEHAELENVGFHPCWLMISSGIFHGFHPCWLMI